MCVYVCVFRFHKCFFLEIDHLYMFKVQINGKFWHELINRWIIKVSWMLSFEYPQILALNFDICTVIKCEAIYVFSKDFEIQTICEVKCTIWFFFSLLPISVPSIRTQRQQLQFHVDVDFMFIFPETQPVFVQRKLCLKFSSNNAKSISNQPRQVPRKFLTYDVIDWIKFGDHPWVRVMWFAGAKPLNLSTLGHKVLFA